ncbi:glutaredoxin domain-containing protein [Pantoea sp. 18069]|uniref:glutaredoxin domain-containing protein n=1 Tax=Pantoea sp. 18069 TaxID=2681415 RepID=UPI00190F9FE4|nr:glutaredoxin domain-containing protein [Pantoea sp. 18069]
MLVSSVSHRSALVAAMVLTMAAFTVHEAQAQVIYRSVGADGRVTFSDREPNTARAAVTAEDARAPANAGDALPHALREVQARFPVTLYTGSDCSPCASARALLVTRGIPFTELSVQTNADVQALQSLSGQSQLPFATIGRQHLTGFAAGEWGQYLDAAGYPQTSALPANYRQAPVRPLAPAPAPAPAAAPAETERRMPAPPASTNRVTPTNPAGLSF